MKAREDFDWDLYSNGYNGANLVNNCKIKAKGKDRVFCQDSWAAEDYKKYCGDVATDAVEPKDFIENMAAKVKAMTILNDDEMLVSTAGGNATVVNLNKETKFFELYGGDKKTFVEWIKNPEMNKQFIDLNLMVKVNKSGKGDLFAGHIYKLYKEYQDQIAVPTKAYIGKITSSNKGGFTLDIQGVRAFMPFSLSAISKETVAEDLVGTTTEVMIESFSQRTGFVVSRKKYLKFTLPTKLAKLSRDKVWDGVVSGIGAKENNGVKKYFGLFIEIRDGEDKYVGLMHKTLMSDSLYADFKEGKVKVGAHIDLWIHDVAEDKVVFSDIPLEEREDIIKIREAQDEEEKKRSEIKMRSRYSNSSNSSISSEKMNALVNHFQKQ